MQPLGIKPGCTQSEIRKAYQNISLTIHPDKDKNTEKGFSTQQALARIFRDVQEAYETLSNPETRSQYDRDHGISAAPPQTVDKVKAQDLQTAKQHNDKLATVVALQAGQNSDRLGADVRIESTRSNNETKRTKGGSPAPIQSHQCGQSLFKSWKRMISITS